MKIGVFFGFFNAFPKPQVSRIQFKLQKHLAALPQGHKVAKYQEALCEPLGL